MTEENNFCVSCGAMLPPGAEFCPSCGAGVDGRTNPHSARPSPGYATAQPSGLNVSLFILIYGVLALIVGLYGTYSGLTFDEAAYNEMRELYESIGMTIGPWDPSFATELLISGVLCLISGVLALLSYWLQEGRAQDLRRGALHRRGRHQLRVPEFHQHNRRTDRRVPALP